MNRARIQLTLGCLFAASIGLSTVHPWGNPRSGVQPGVPLLQGSNAPENLRTALEAKCGDCHSQRTRYPVYSHLAPISWMIERDVRGGRNSVDLSQWQSYSKEDQINALTRMASVVHAGQMPPRMYVMLHPGARLSSGEQQLIYDWAKAERKHIRQQLSHRSDQSSVESRTDKP
jgi:hypothetical protein